MWSSIIFLYPFIPKKKLLYWGVVALLFECFTPIAAMLLQSNLIDSVFIHGQLEKFTPLLSLFLLFFFAPKFIFSIRKVTFFEISYQLQEALITEFLKKVYTLPTEIFQRETGAKLLNIIKTDVPNASDSFVNSVLSETLYAVLTTVFLVGALIRVSLPLLFATIVVGVVYYYLHSRFSHKTKELSKQVQVERANLSAAMEENISSVRETIAFNRQEWRQKHYEKSYQSYFQSLKLQNLHGMKTMIFSEPLLFVIKFLVIIFGCLLVMKNRISLGTFIVSSTLSEQLITVIGQLFQLGLAQKRLEPYVMNLRRIFDMTEDNFGNQVIDEKIESIQFKGVSFEYETLLGREALINGFSLDLPMGKKIAFVGESGCGKSTLARLLLRQLKPQSGEIHINGVNIAQLGQTFAERISMVSQQPYFLPLTVRENLEFGRAYEDSEIERICKETLCWDFVQRLPHRFETLLGEGGANLSGGEKQRLALARVLLRNPELLILDEATSALDVETEYRLLQNLDKIRAGKTTIIIAHRKSAIENADVVYSI